MTSLPVLDIVFAHHDEPIPRPFAPPANLSERQFKRWKSRRMAHFLLETLFEKYQLDPQLLAHIQRTPSGRPYVNHPHVDFNLSDSGDWMALIFCVSEPKSAVGIDIEQPQKTRRFADLLRHYANLEEIHGLLVENQTPFAQLEDRFYLSWCMHEAVLKAQGVGIVKLSEVQHFPAKRLVQSRYCPSGTVHFYHQLPFYLCYFYENIDNHMPSLMRWQGGFLQKISKIRPLVYRSLNPLIES